MNHRLPMFALLTGFVISASAMLAAEPTSRSIPARAVFSGERIHLQPTPAPMDQPTGFLGVEIRTDWMDGDILMRLPETIWSPMGLHFIDHTRPEMAPLSPLEIWPVWSEDLRTGTLRYRARTKEGLIFSAKAVPGQDCVNFTLTIRNETGRELAWVGPDCCLVLSECPQLGKRHDLTNTYTWIDGKWTSLATTTPTAAEKHRFPWPLLLTKETAPTYRGERDMKDGAWIVDQVADLPIIARVTEDQKHLVAATWDDYTWLMTNSDIPCLHAGPSAKGPLPNNKELTWHGTVYLLPNSPATLHACFDRDAKR